MLTATVISGPGDTKFLMCNRDGSIAISENQVEAIRDIEGRRGVTQDQF